MEQDSWRLVALRGLSYAGEHAVRLSLTAVLGIFVARYLGPEGLGLLSFAQSVFGLLMPVVLLGFPAVLVREFSTGPDWRPTLASALAAQAPIAVLVAVVGFVIVGVSRGFETQAVLTALAMTPLPLLTANRSVRSLLEATGRSHVILFAGITAGLIASTVKILAIVAAADVWVFALAGTIEVGIVTCGLIVGIPVRPRIHSLTRYVRLSVIKDLIGESWPLLLSALAVTIYMRVDVVMLGLLASDQETGIYTAAANLSEVWYFLPMAAVAALRPLLSRLHAQGAEGHYEWVLQRFMAGTAAVCYIAVVAILAAGPTVIAVLYGAEYEPATGVLQLHILAAPFVFLGVAAGPWFIDNRLSRFVLVRAGIGAVTNVFLNVLLIPAFGARGAAVATLISYASGVGLNGLSSGGRRVFWFQLRALVLIWRPMATPNRSDC